MSCQKRSAQRFSRPPWLKPITSTWRPDASAIARIANTTYSVAVGMSPSVNEGSVTMQYA